MLYFKLILFTERILNKFSFNKKYPYEFQIEIRKDIKNYCLMILKSAVLFAECNFIKYNPGFKSFPNV